MTYFSAFSGIGGIELGVPSDWECVGFSEIEPRAVKIYQRHFPNHRNYGDITKLKASDLPEFDLLVGGFPCQSFSIAGSRRGFNDTRGTLFFELARIIRAKRPRYLLLENVKGLLSHDQGRTYKTILSTLAELGYDTEGLVFDSYFFDAGPRTRIFMLAYNREQGPPSWEGRGKALPLYSCLSERIRTANPPTGESEISRGSGRIIRAFARLPDWLHSWDTFYPPKEMSR